MLFHCTPEERDADAASLSFNCSPMDKIDAQDCMLLHLLSPARPPPPSPLSLLCLPVPIKDDCLLEPDTICSHRRKERQRMKGR